MSYPDDFLNKLVCGDILKVIKDIPDQSIDLVVTSPPYNLKNSGMGLTRDSVVSVMDAEELNSAKSSVTLQRTDRHGIVGQKPTDFQVSL